MSNLNLRYSAATNRGSRAENQDNLRVGKKIPWIEPLGRYAARGTLNSRRAQIFCVCDGMGGEALGDAAALLALKAIDEFASGLSGLEPLEEIALQAAHAAQETVLAFYDEQNCIGGCTLAMIVVRGDRYVVLNIGDSPVFYYNRRAKELAELSQRHNMAWEKRRRGEEPNEYDECRLVNFLGNPGVDAEEMLHYVSGRLEPGDSLLACSDGVSEGLSEERLAHALKWRRGAKWLTAQAAKMSESDNCTAVCVRAKRGGK